MPICPLPAKQITALKQTGAQRIFEGSFPSDAIQDDPDIDRVALLTPKMHLDLPRTVRDQTVDMLPAYPMPYASVSPCIKPTGS